MHLTRRYAVVGILMIAVGLLGQASALRLTPYLPPYNAAGNPGLAGTGVLVQNEVDTWDDASWIGIACSPAVTEVEVTLRMYAWVPGDVLTLEVQDYWLQGVRTAPTEGVPPVAVVTADSPESCVEMRVLGTRVTAAVAYTLFVEYTE